MFYARHEAHMLLLNVSLPTEDHDVHRCRLLGRKLRWP